MSDNPSTFFLDPGQGPRSWQRGALVGDAVERAVCVRFEDWGHDALPTVGSEASVYHAHGQDGRLFAQKAEIDSVTSTADGALILRLLLLSEPVLYDRRAAGRVACQDLPVIADVDDDIGCSVLDFGPTGFSIVTRQRHVPGSLAELTVHCQGEVLIGRGAVKSATPRRDGSTRYGIHVLKMAGSGLSSEMRRISDALQGGGKTTVTS